MARSDPNRRCPIVSGARRVVVFATPTDEMAVSTASELWNDHRRQEQRMGRIVSNFFISLDGVVEAPNEWHFPYFDEAMGRVVGAGMQTQGSMLMGRRLYDEWSEYWPAQGAEVPFSSHINNIPK
jgi:hypothetical protein